MQAVNHTAWQLLQGWGLKDLLLSQALFQGRGGGFYGSLQISSLLDSCLLSQAPKAMALL